MKESGRRKTDALFFTIELPDAEKVVAKIEDEGKKYKFSARSHDHPYELELELFQLVDDKMMCKVGQRNVTCKIKKKEKGQWSRLLHPEGKLPHFIKNDWDKWVSQDDADADVSDAMDLSKLDMDEDYDDGDEESDDAADQAEQAAQPSASSAEEPKA